MTMSIRLNEEDHELFKAYAAMHGITVSELVRQSVMEHIEDEHDLKLAEKAYADFLADPVTYSHEEVKKELGL